MSEHVQSGEANDKPSVLVVDDDAAIRREYHKILGRAGFDVQVAEDGRMAIELLRAKGVDLIVSDLEMPHMTGVELLREVRQVDLDVPMILITGNPNLDSAIDAVHYGAFRYLTKPVGVEQLATVAREAVALHELARLKRLAIEVVGSEGKQAGDRASLDAHFDSALDKLWVAFQPIVEATERRVLAYEALMRSGDPVLKSPMDLLDAAERLGRMQDLGRRVRSLVASNAARAPQDVLLFVNLHSLDLNDDELFASSSPLSAVAGRVVLEITERASLDGIAGVAGKVAALRALGYRVAVDDLGAGYAGLTSFTQIEPEFVKLDMSLVRGVDASPRKQSVIRAITRLCSTELGIQVITEGIETAAERDTVLGQGCQLLQGYLFARPERDFPSPVW